MSQMGVVGRGYANENAPETGAFERPDEGKPLAFAVAAIRPVTVAHVVAAIARA